MPASSIARRIAALAVVAGAFINPLPVIAPWGGLEGVLLLSPYILWMASPWLILGLSLYLTRRSATLLGLHVVISLGLLAISMLLYAFSVVGFTLFGFTESMSWVYCLCYLGFPTVGIPIAGLVLIASLLSKKKSASAEK